MSIPSQLTESKDMTAHDRERWHSVSRDLWQLLRRDFRSYRDELASLYEVSAGDMVQRPANLVQRVARETATLYVRPPARVWRTARSAAVFAELQARMVAHYRQIDADRKLRVAQEHLVALGNATVWVWPARDSNGVRWVNIPPHQQWYELDDLVANDVASVKRWWVQLPVTRDETIGTVRYGVAEITRTSAVWVAGPLVGTGVWQDDGSNPLGEIPVVLLRQSEPAIGEMFAWPPEDLLAAAHAIALDHTDQGHIARLQGYGQPVIHGMDTAEAQQLTLGPDNVIGLPDKEQSFEFVHGDPPLKEYAEATQQFTRSTLAMNGVNPAAVLKSSAITAVAKKIELSDRETERTRMVVDFEAAETRLYNLTVHWLSILRPGGFDYDRFGRVDVEYREPVMDADPLHEAQARRMAFEDGQASPAREYARVHGVPLDVARGQTVSNVEELAALRAIVVSDDRVAQGREPSSE